MRDLARHHHPQCFGERNASRLQHLTWVQSTLDLMQVQRKKQIIGGTYDGGEGIDYPEVDPSPGLDTSLFAKLAPRGVERRFALIDGAADELEGLTLDTEFELPDQENILVAIER